jgi:hypothetical protein
MQDPRLKQFFEFLKSNNKIDGTYEQFEAQMQDPKTREQFVGFLNNEASDVIEGGYDIDKFNREFGFVTEQEPPKQKEFPTIQADLSKEEEPGAGQEPIPLNAYGDKQPPAAPEPQVDTGAPEVTAPDMTGINQEPETATLQTDLPPATLPPSSSPEEQQYLDERGQPVNAPPSAAYEQPGAGAAGPYIDTPAVEDDIVASPAYDLVSKGITTADDLKTWVDSKREVTTKALGGAKTAGSTSRAEEAAQSKEEREAIAEAAMNYDYNRVIDPISVYDHYYEKYGEDANRAYSATKNFLELEQSIRAAQVDGKAEEFNNYAGLMLPPEWVEDGSSRAATYVGIKYMLEKGGETAEKARENVPGIDQLIGQMDEMGGQDLYDSWMKMGEAGQVAQDFQEEENVSSELANLQMQIDKQGFIDEERQAYEDWGLADAPDWVKSTTRVVLSSFAGMVDRVATSFGDKTLSPDELEGDLKEAYKNAKTDRERSMIMVRAAAMEAADRKIFLAKANIPSRLQGGFVEDRVPVWGPIRGEDGSVTREVLLYVTMNPDGSPGMVRDHLGNYVYDKGRYDAAMAGYYELSEEERNELRYKDFSLSRGGAMTTQVVMDMLPAIFMAAGTTALTAGTGAPVAVVRAMSLLGSASGTFMTVYGDFYQQGLEKNPETAGSYALTQALGTALIEQLGGLEAGAGRRLSGVGRKEAQEFIRKYAGEYAEQVSKGGLIPSAKDFMSKMLAAAKKTGTQSTVEWIEEIVDQRKERALNLAYQGKMRPESFNEEINTALSVFASTPIIMAMGGSNTSANRNKLGDLIYESLQTEPGAFDKGVQQAMESRIAQLEKTGRQEEVTDLRKKFNNLKSAVNNARKAKAALDEQIPSTRRNTQEYAQLQSLVAQRYARGVQMFEPATTPEQMVKMGGEVIGIESKINELTEKLSAPEMAQKGVMIDEGFMLNDEGKWIDQEGNEATPEQADELNKKYVTDEEEVQKTNKSPKKDEQTEESETQEEVEPTDAKSFTEALSPNAKTFDAGFGEKAYNYTTDTGVEVTIKDGGEVGTVNRQEVSSDLQIDFIGSDPNTRGEGRASEELDRIIAEADKADMSLSVVVDPDGAVTNPDGTQSGVPGLSADQLKDWYSRKGFIFDKGSNYGYRPAKSEESSKFTKPEAYIAKEGEVSEETIKEFYSDPDTFYDALDNGEITEEGFYDIGDGVVYYDGSQAREVSNIESDFLKKNEDTGKVEVIYKLSDNTEQAEGTVEGAAPAETTETPVSETPPAPPSPTAAATGVEMELESTQPGSEGRKYKANYKVPIMPGKEIKLPNGASSFEISSEGGNILGTVKGSDFPGEKMSDERGEVFILNVKEKRKGYGKDLMLEALYLMRMNDVSKVKFTVPSKEGKPFNDALERQGYISKIREDERTGTAEYEILDKVVEEKFNEKIEAQKQSTETTTEPTTETNENLFSETERGGQNVTGIADVTGQTLKPGTVFEYQKADGKATPVQSDPEVGWRYTTGKKAKVPDTIQASINEQLNDRGLSRATPPEAGRTQNRKAALAMEPTDVEDRVIQSLLSGVKLNKESVIKELGLRNPRTGEESTDEINSRRYMYPNPKKGEQGITIENFAENIVNDMSQGVGIDENYQAPDVNDIRNEIIDVLRMAAGATSLVDRMTDKHGVNGRISTDPYARAEQEMDAEAIEREQEAEGQRVQDMRYVAGDIEPQDPAYWDNVRQEDLLRAGIEEANFDDAGFWERMFGKERGQAVTELIGRVVENYAKRAGISLDEARSKIAFARVGNVPSATTKGGRDAANFFASTLGIMGETVETLNQDGKPYIVPAKYKKIEGVTGNEDRYYGLFRFLDRFPEIYKQGADVEYYQKAVEAKLAELEATAKNTHDFYIQDISDEYIESKMKEAKDNLEYEQLAHWEYAKRNKQALIEQNRNVQKGDLLMSIYYLKNNPTYSSYDAYMLLESLTRYNVDVQIDPETGKKTVKRYKRTNTTINSIQNLHSGNTPVMRDLMYDEMTGSRMENIRAEGDLEYRTQIREKVNGADFDQYEFKKVGKGRWLKFDQTTTDNEAIESLHAITSTSHNFPARWCTGSSIKTAAAHLSGGDFYVYVDESGQARLAIRYQGDSIGEPPRGLAHGQDITNDNDVEILGDFLQNDAPNGNEYLHQVKQKKLIRGVRDTGFKEIPEDYTADDLEFLLRATRFGHSPIEEAEINKVKDLIARDPISKDMIASKYGYSGDEVYISSRGLHALTIDDVVDSDLFKVKLVYGNISVYARNEISLEAARRFAETVESVTGAVTIETELLDNSEGKDIVFKKLKNVGGGIEVMADRGTNYNLKFPKLESAGSFIVHAALDMSIDAPNLVEVDGAVGISGRNVNISKLRKARAVEIQVTSNNPNPLPNLEEVEELRIALASTEDKIIEFPKLRTVEELILSDNKGYSFPSLTRVGGGFMIGNGTIDAPKLRTVGGDIGLRGAGGNLNALESVGSLVMQNTHMDLPSLKTAAAIVLHGFNDYTHKFESLEELTGKAGYNVVFRLAQGNVDLPKLRSVYGDIRIHGYPDQGSGVMKAPKLSNDAGSFSLALIGGAVLETDNPVSFDHISIARSGLWDGGKRKLSEMVNIKDVNTFAIDDSKNIEFDSDLKTKTGSGPDIHVKDSTVELPKQTEAHLIQAEKATVEAPALRRIEFGLTVKMSTVIMPRLEEAPPSLLMSNSFRFNRIMVPEKSGMTKDDVRESGGSGQLYFIDETDNLKLFRQDNRAAIIKGKDKYAVLLGKNADISSPLHEMSHMFEDVLTPEEKAIVHKWTGTKKWTRETSEKFAKGWERFLWEGKIDIPALQEVFKKFSRWLKSIISDNYFNDIEELNDDMRMIYERMLASDAEIMTKNASKDPDVNPELKDAIEQMRDAWDSYKNFGIVPQGNDGKPIDQFTRALFNVAKVWMKTVAKPTISKFIKDLDGWLGYKTGYTKDSPEVNKVFDMIMDDVTPYIPAEAMFEGSAEPHRDAARQAFMNLSVGESATRNADGTVYKGNDILVPIASLDVTGTELTPDALPKMLERMGLKNTDNLKIWQHKTSRKNTAGVSIAIPADRVEDAKQLAAALGHDIYWDPQRGPVSIIPSGTPRSVTMDELPQLLSEVGRGRMPSWARVETEETDKAPSNPAARAWKNTLDAIQVFNQGPKNQSNAERSKALYDAIRNFAKAYRNSLKGGGDIHVFRNKVQKYLGIHPTELPGASHLIRMAFYDVVMEEKDFEPVEGLDRRKKGRLVRLAKLLGLDPKVRHNLDKILEDYEPQTKEDLAEFADAFIYDVGDEVAQAYVQGERQVTDKSGHYAKRVAIGIRLAQMLNIKANQADTLKEREYHVARIGEMVSALQGLGRDLGRAVDAFKLFNELGKDNLMIYFAKAMDQTTNKIFDEYSDFVNAVINGQQTAQQFARDRTAAEAANAVKSTRSRKASKEAKQRRQKKQQSLASKLKNFFRGNLGIIPKQPKSIEEMFGNDADMAKAAVEYGYMLLEDGIRDKAKWVRKIMRDTGLNRKSANMLWSEGLGPENRTFNEIVNPETLSEVVREHLGTPELAENLENLGFTPEQAEQMAEDLNERYKQLYSGEVNKAIKERQFKGIPKKLEDIINSLTDPDNPMTPGDIKAAIAEILDLDRTLTDEELEELNELIDYRDQLPHNSSLRYEANAAVLARMGEIANVEAVRGVLSGKKAELIMPLWYAAILSGSGTQIVNFGANLLNGFVMNGIKAMSDAFRTGNTAAFQGQLYGFVTSFGRAANEFMRTWRQGRGSLRGSKFFINSSELNQYRMDMLNRNNEWYKAPVRAYAAQMKYVGWFMMGVDNGFAALSSMSYKVSRAAEYMKKVDPSLKGKALTAAALEHLYGAGVDFNKAHQKAKQELRGVKGVTARDIEGRAWEILDQTVELRNATLADDAVSWGMQLTFNYDPKGTLGAFANGIDNMSARIPALRYVVPFTRIVANVINEQIDYTPIGFVRARRGGSFSSLNWFASQPKSHAKTAQDARMLIGKAVVGTTVMGTLLAKALMGDDDDGFQITAGGPVSAEKRAQLYSVGWRPYSVRFTKDGQYWNYQWTPFGLGLAIVGTIADQKNFNKKKYDETTAIEAAGYAILQVPTVVLNMSFLRGLGVAFGRLQRGVTKLDSTEDVLYEGTSAFAGGFIPRGLSDIEAIIQLAATGEKPVYEPKTGVDFFKKEVPFLRTSLDKRIAWSGDEVDVKVVKPFDIPYSDVVMHIMGADRISSPSHRDNPFFNLLADRNVLGNIRTIGDPMFEGVSLSEIDRELYDWYFQNAALAFNKYGNQHLSKLQSLSDDELLRATAGAVGMIKGMMRTAVWFKASGEDSEVKSLLNEAYNLDFVDPLSDEERSDIDRENMEVIPFKYFKDKKK